MLRFTEFLQEGRTRQGGFTNVMYKKLLDKKFDEKIIKKFIDPYIFKDDISLTNLATALQVDLKEIQKIYANCLRFLKPFREYYGGLPDVSLETVGASFKEAMGLSKSFKISYSGSQLTIKNGTFFLLLKNSDITDNVKTLTDSPYCFLGDYYKYQTVLCYKFPTKYVIVNLETVPKGYKTTTMQFVDTLPEITSPVYIYERDTSKVISYFIDRKTGELFKLET